jgi:hypothetical protein
VEKLPENLFPVPVSVRVLLPNERICGYRVKVMEIFWPEGPEREQLALQSRLEIKQHYPIVHDRYS